MQLNNLIKLSAAGSGKTWWICQDALAVVNQTKYPKKILLLSYTNRGVEAIETEIKKQNLGLLHPQIIVLSWYSFLMKELLRPYQSYIFNINEIRSFDFHKIYGFKNMHKKGTRGRYITCNADILPNEASELVLEINKRSEGLVFKRLERVYKSIYIDEIQDMAGYDLNVIEEIMHSNIYTVCVGDNKQATFKTNNSRMNKNKSGSKVWNFFEKLIKNKKAELEINSVSRRFNEEICTFANAVYPNENKITTSMKRITLHDGVFLVRAKDVLKYFFYYKPTVLRYDKKTDVGSLIATNFGECKGLTFERIIIFPNGPFLNFVLKGKRLANPEKYYVAVTRARYSIAIVVDELPNSEMFESTILNLGTDKINAKKIIAQKFLQS